VKQVATAKTAQIWPNTWPDHWNKPKPWLDHWRQFTQMGITQPHHNGATSAIHVLYRHIHCIVFILDYKKAWRICIALGNQYNTIHPKKMY
jgi:hypothetical protein